MSENEWRALPYADKMRHILLRLRETSLLPIRWERTVKKYGRMVSNSQMGGMYPMFRSLSYLQGTKDHPAIVRATRMLLDQADRLQVDITKEGNIFKVRERDTGDVWEAHDPGALALGLDMRDRAIQTSTRNLTPVGGAGIRWGFNGPGGEPPHVKSPDGGPPGPPLEPREPRKWMSSIATYVKDVRSNLVRLAKLTGDQRIFDYVHDMMSSAQHARQQAEQVLVNPFLKKADQTLGRKGKITGRRKSMAMIGKALAKISDEAEAVGSKTEGGKGSPDGNAAADAWIAANRERIYDEFGLTPEERKFGTWAMDEWFPNAATEVNIPRDWVWRGYLPRVNARPETAPGAYDYFDALQSHRPAEDFFAMHTRSVAGDVPLREFDLYTLAEMYSQQGMRHKYLGDQVNPRTGVVTPGHLTKVRELVGEYKDPHGRIPHAYLPIAIAYNGAVGKISPRRARAISTSRGITESWIHRAERLQEATGVESLLQPLVDRLKLRLDSRDINLWVDYVLTLNRAKVFGMHPMRTARQITGPLFFTLPRVGPKAFSVALKEVLDPGKQAAIRQRAERAGVLTGAQPDMFLSNRTPLLRLADETMKPYALLDTFERLIAFRSQEILTEQAVANFRKHGSTDKFVQESRLWSLDPIYRKSVLGLLESGKHAEAITRHAQLLASHTVMDYSKYNNPYWADGTWGRLFGQYGRWPLAAFEIVTAMAKHGTYQQRAEMVGIYATVAAAVYGMGQAFGLDTRDWIPAFHSSYWAGGPQLSNLVGVTAWAGGQPGAGGSLARNLRDDPIVGGLGFLYKQFMPAGDVMGPFLVEALEMADVNASRRQLRMFGLPDPELANGNLHGFVAHALGFHTTYDPQPKIRNIFWEPTMKAAEIPGEFLRDLTEKPRGAITGGMD